MTPVLTAFARARRLLLACFLGAILLGAAACGESATEDTTDAGTSIDATAADIVGDISADPDSAPIDAGPCPLDGLICDDGDPCTFGDRCAAGACVSGANLCECKSDTECAKFGDGNACNGTLYCDKQAPIWRCRMQPASAVTCPTTADTACATNACDPATGKCAMLPRADSSACNDGELCTDNDRCKAGKCVGDLAWFCAASCGDDDCASKNSADLCSGTWYCEKAQKPWACKLNTATAITCDPSEDTPCSANACDKATGKCAKTPKNQGKPCDDGQLCTVNDACKDGTCAGKDACKCALDIDCQPLDDGNACNGAYFCDKQAGVCKTNPSTIVSCPKAAVSACVVNQCDPTSGLCAPQAVAANTPCDDGNHCTGGETCINNACTPALNICACTKQADCAGKDDGDLCNGTAYCDVKSGHCANNPATIVVCPSGQDTACTKNACDRGDGKCAVVPVAAAVAVQYPSVGQTGWVQLPTGTTLAVAPPCDDGNPCTVGDMCLGTVCDAGVSKCACQNDAECAPIDDGNACNGSLFCDKSGADATKWQCRPNPKTVVVCGGPSPLCTALACQPATGKCAPAALPVGATCSDGDVCTEGDGCLDGKCLSGPQTCGCASHADCVAQDDGNACNGTLLCDKSSQDPKNWACKPNPASIVLCPQSTKACQVILCDPTNGSCVDQAIKDGGVCDDGDACTAQTTCKTGACVGAAADCDDKDPCTKDSCDAKTGCAHKAGVCADANACTADTCDAKTGKCTYVPVAKGAPCDADGSGCTVGDACESGVCKAGTAVTCAPASAVCQVAVCQGTGSATHKCVHVAAKDGSACDDAGSCQSGGKCLAGQCAGGTKARLFGRRFPDATSEVRISDLAADSDGAMVAVGSKTALVGGKPVQDWYVARTDQAGAAIWEKTYRVSDIAGQSAQAVAAHAGGFVVAGDVKPTAFTQLGLLLYSAQGAKVWERAFTVGGSTSAHGIARHASGALAVVGEYTAQSKKPAGVLLRLSSDGQPVWQVKQDEAAGLRFFGVGLLSDASVAVGGYLWATGSSRVGWVGRYDPAGKQLWHKSLADDGWFGGVAPVAEDRFWIAGKSKVDGADRPTRMLLSASGQVLQSATRLQAGRFERVVSLGAGGLALVGWRQTGKDLYDATLTAIDSFGNPQWQTVIGIAGASTKGLGVAALKGGKIGVCGEVIESGGATRGLLVRATAFGHTSCAAAGTCLSLTAKQCDDGKPCTADLCDGQSGCVHLAAAGFSCVPADGCSFAGSCNKGVCTPGASGRLYTRQIGDGLAGYTVVGLHPEGQGLRVFLGDTHRLTTTTVDAGGDTQSVPVVWDTTNATIQWNDVQAGEVGDWYARGAATSYNGYISGHLARFSSAGKQLWRVGPGISVGNGVHTRVASALLRPDGASLMFYQVYAGATVSAAVRGVAATGTAGAVHSLHDNSVGSQHTVQATALGALGDAAVALQKSGVDASADVLLHTLSDAGALLAKHAIDLGGVEYPRGLAAAEQAGWLLTGVQDAAGKTTRSFIALVDAKGKVAWQKVAVQPDNAVFSRIVTVGSGAQAVHSLLGTKTTAAGTQLLIQAADSQGAPIWQQAAKVADNLVGVVARSWLRTADGGFAVGGRALYLDKERPFVSRLDAWGHASCSAAGGCASKQTADCDDQNACTADFCDAGKGCVFLPLVGCK